MRIERPSPRDIERLTAFLASPERPEGTFSYLEMRGFLFAIATGPVLVQPSEWLPAIFGGEEGGFRDLDEANAILGTIMACYNLAAHAGRITDTIPPELVGIDERSDDSRRAWSRGFALGFDYLRDDWAEVLDGMDADDLAYFDGAFQDLTVWLDPPTRQARLGIDDAELDELLSACRAVLPRDLATMAQFGREAYDRGRQVPAAAERPPDVGRNDPCPCGSGKKYKRCCLVN